MSKITAFVQAGGRPPSLSLEVRKRATGSRAETTILVDGGGDGDLNSRQFPVIVQV
jgi:hypothetical protein